MQNAVSQLPWESWFTLLVAIGAVVALARDMITPALALLGADVVLLVAGVITPEQAFSGFANPAPITVAALYVVARAVEKTGALQPLITATLGDGNGGRGPLARLLAPTAGASALLNNTPIVAMLTPQVAEWAERRGQAASRYLMPISFATILGGTLTVIGTSTNLVVSGLMEASAMAPIGMFEITKIGLPVAVAGVAILVALAPVVLPDRRPAREQFASDIREYVINLHVQRGGALDGYSVEAGGLRHLQGVFLAEIEREGQVIAPAAPTVVLRGGDRLTFAGRVDTIRDLQNIRGLQLLEHEHARAFNGSGHTFFEVVVSGTSALVGKTLKEVEFRSRYQAAVLAIHRAGDRVREKLGGVRLKEGDTLLLISDQDFSRRWRDSNEFLLVSRLGGVPPVSTRQAWLVAAVAFGIVVIAGVGLLPILHASLLGGFVLLLAKVLTPAEARGAVDLEVILTIAASFGIGAAMEASGLAAALGDWIVGAIGPFGPMGLLLAVVLATLALTEMITNNAAAALMFPIAFATAIDGGLDPRPFAIALTIAASASFLTPIGYQTNTMVYGPGGYRFGDYARLGLPLTLVVVVTIMLVTPWFWPF